MNLIEAKDAVLLFVSQWAGTTAPRLAAIGAGLLLGAYAVQAAWDRRLRGPFAAALVIAALLLAAMGVSPRVLHVLVGLDYVTRARIVAGAVSLTVLLVTLESIRRSRLQERYALLWLITGLIIFVGALAPDLIKLFGSLFGATYQTSVIAVVFTFVLLVAFHVSLALSMHDDRQTRLAQRCALLEARIDALEKTAGTGPAASEPPRPARTAAPVRPASLLAGARETLTRRFGARWLAFAVIAASYGAALAVGLSTRDPMIGDEVTHYYMLTNQADHLPTPVFRARIPLADGREEFRHYPHPNGWHYIGALVYRAFGRSQAAVQVYQSLFWLQFLVVAWLLAQSRADARSHAPALFVLVLASLPTAIIFSVAYYQDIPSAAQVLTAFYLLTRRRPVWGALALVLGISIKATAVVFAPIYVVLAAWFAFREGAAGPRRSAWVKAVSAGIVSAAILAAASWAWTSFMLNRSEGGTFYPVEALTRRFHAWTAPHGVLPSPAVAVRPDAAAAGAPAFEAVEDDDHPVIANHPGDLRIPANWLVYGGGLLWIVVAAGLLARLARAVRRQKEPPPSPAWLLGAGLFGTAVLAGVLRTAPDARFFLPVLPLLLLPLAEWVVRTGGARRALPVLAALAVLQAGVVYGKVAHLRRVSPALREAIDFLTAHPPLPSRIFMYPEGNYRLFPVKHEWYLAYRLREFWNADNDTRLRMLHEHHIGAIVIKKHLVAPGEAPKEGLGIYPESFVRDIARDERFTRVFDNEAIRIVAVPPPPPPPPLQPTPEPAAP